MMHIFLLFLLANATINKNIPTRKVFTNYVKIDKVNSERNSKDYKNYKDIKTKEKEWIREKEKLLEMIEKKDKELKKWINLSISFILIMALIIIASLVYFLDKATKISIVSPYPKSTLKVNLLGPSFRDVITDIDPTIRETANRIEIWEKEFLKKGVRKEEAEKILLPYTNHTNNRIRANACKALHHFNSEKAIEILKEMLKSPDIWMRLSSIWALSQIKTKKAIELLLVALEDKNERVKKKAMEVLKHLIETENIESSLREKLEEAIKNIIL